MKVLINPLLFLLSLFFFGVSNCSSSFGTLSNQIVYEGRFSKIENLPGFEVLDAEESMSNYNITIISNGGLNICDLSCKLKAATISVIVPVDESNMSLLDRYLLKVRLLNELSMVPAESFIENRQILTTTLKMIEFHLFYRIDEYTRFIRETVSRFPALEAHEHHEHDFVEKAWNTFLKPIYVILRNIIKLSVSNKDVNLQLDSMIPSLVRLISSPIEEESKIASELVGYSLFHYPDNLVVNAIINNLESIIVESLKGDVPLLAIGPILQFVGDIILPCSQLGKDHFITSRILSIIKTRLLSVTSHAEFVWIYDPFAHVAVQYFSFFEVSAGKSIKRSPFEPVFPEESPFEESEQVILMRRNLLIGIVDDNPQNIVNVFARLALLHHLSMYQFYPRSMIPDIFELIRNTFIRFQNIDSAFSLYSLITKPEIFSGNDEVAKFVKDGLKSISDVLAHCERFSYEMRNICRQIEHQIEKINQVPKKPSVKDRLETNRSLRDLITS